MLEQYVALQRACPNVLRSPRAGVSLLARMVCMYILSIKKLYYMRMCVCVCACAFVRVRVRVRVSVRVRVRVPVRVR